MRKILIKVFFVMLLLVGTMSTAAFAEMQTEEWKAGGNYPNIYYQLIYRDGGNEWYGVRFANQNTYRVKIYVSLFDSNTKADISKKEIYLEGGNTNSEVLQLGPNVGFSFFVRGILPSDGTTPSIPNK